MFYWGFGCEATSDGLYTTRYPWMACYDPSVPVPSSAEGVTDEQIENANAVLDGKSEKCRKSAQAQICVANIFISQSKP